MIAVTLLLLNMALTHFTTVLQTHHAVCNSVDNGSLKCEGATEAFHVHLLYKLGNLLHGGMGPQEVAGDMFIIYFQEIHPRYRSFDLLPFYLNLKILCSLYCYLANQSHT